MKKLFVYSFLLVLALQALAQKPGGINVLVFDGELGEPLIGATVVITGTTNGSVTDLDGKARITGLAPGNYSVSISFIGYQTKTIENVEVKDGEVTSMDLSLHSGDISLEAVVVTAEAEKKTESAMLTLQKKSAKLFDAISADQFSRNGDRDAASAVQRVVGVTIQSGKYVYVRGLGDRYSKSMLNGADIPGLDPNSNSVQMDLFPSNLIDNITVYKTLSPDLPGDFSGGLVNITTKEFPEKLTVQATTNFGYNTKTTLKNDFLSYNHGNSNWLAKDDGTRALPSLIKGYGYDQQNFPQPYLSSADDINNVIHSYNQHQFVPTTKTAPLNQFSAISFGNLLHAGKIPIGVVGGITYNRKFQNYNDGHIVRYQPITSTSESLNSNRRVDMVDHRSVDNTTIGTMLNLSAKLHPNHKLSLNMMHNAAGTDEARFQQGGTAEIAGYYTPNNISNSSTIHYTQRQLTNVQIKGEHVIPSLNGLSFNWFSAGTHTLGSEPDIRFLNLVSTIDQEGDTTWLQTNRSAPGRYYRTLEDNYLDNRINFTLPLNIANRDVKLKFGGAYTTKNRTYHERRYEYFMAKSLTDHFNGDATSIFNNDSMQYVGNNVPQYYNSYIRNGSLPTNNYKAQQNVSAAYVMFETSMFQHLKVNAGARYEGTNMSVHTINNSVKGNLKVGDLLPMLNMTYNYQENANLRFVFAKSLARPTFREFAPLVTFAFFNDPLQAGNANLKRTDIYNFDFRWEMFPRAGEYVAVSTFYKDFRNPIVNTLNPVAGGENNLEFQYDNVSRGVSYGIELDYRKSLGFIADALENFRLSLNGSYIFSRVNYASDELALIRVWNPSSPSYRRMINQAPYTINANLVYQNDKTGWNSSMIFNVSGPSIQMLQLQLPYIQQKPMPSLQFTLQKAINDSWSVRLRARNLLNAVNEKYMENQGTKYVYNSFKTGQSFSFTVTYSIN